MAKEVIARNAPAPPSSPPRFLAQNDRSDMNNENWKQVWVVAANGIALSVRARASELKMRSAPRMIKMMPCLIGNGLCSIIIPAIAMAMRNEKRYVFGVSDVGIYPVVGANRQRVGVLAMRQKHVAARTIILA